MEPIMPKNLREEQDLLVDKWYNSDEDIRMFDYVIKHCSAELKQFILHEKERKEKARKMGIIIN